MVFPNIMKVVETQKSIEDTLTEGLNKIKEQNELLVKNLIKSLQEKISVLNSESNIFTKEVMELGKTYKILQEEVKTFEDKKVLFTERENKINKKTAELEKQEENLFAFHKTLENKRLILKAKEDELLEKQRRERVI